MNKVKNGRVLRRIADKTRKAGKGKSLIAVLAIILTAVLFTSVFTIGGSMAAKQQQSTMRQVGTSAHAGYKYLTKEEYDIVRKDEKIKEVSYRIAVGNAVNNELLKLRTEMGFYEDLDAKFCFCYPETGHMPQEEDELVTSDLVLKALGIPCELGAKVPLTIDTGKRTYEKIFTLCGYFKGDRISQSQIGMVSRKHADKMTPAPTDSAMRKGVDASDYAGRIMADFNFATGFQIEKQVEALTERCGFPENVYAGVNWAYMGNFDMDVVVLVLGLILVILISGYLIIYNIFYINVYQDIRYYGLLKTVGTTEKQLRRIVRRQAYMLSLYGIPAGLLLGGAVGKLLLPVIMDELTFSGDMGREIVLNPWIFIGAAVFSFLTVLISCIHPCRIASRVSAVEAVRYTEGQDGGFGKRKKGKKTKRVHPREMAFQNMKRNRKKVVIVVASLSLALVLLNCIYGLVTGFDMDRFVASMAVSDYSVADATVDNLSVSYDSIEREGVTEEFLEALKRQEGIEDTGNIYMGEIDPVFSNEAYGLLEERIFEDEDARETMEWMLGNLDADGEEIIETYRKERHIDGKVYGISRMVMEKLENVEGEADWERFAGGDYVIATRFDTLREKEIAFFQPGERVTVSNEKGETREYEVLAVADMPDACEFQHYGMFDCNYILPENEYLDFMGDSQPMRTIFDVEAGYEEQTEKWITDYCEQVNPELQYTSKTTIVAEFDGTKNMYAMVGSLLVFILAMIGILNFVNTMVTSVLSRKQEFAMMEAVGMTEKQLKEMLCYEGLFYALFTGVSALAIGSILNLTVVRSIGESFFFFTWRFTVLPVLLSIPAVAVLVYEVPSACCRSIGRVSVVERMRRTE